MYKVSEISKKLLKSKTAIYHKLNTNQLLFKPHLKKVKGVIMLDNTGVDILSNLFTVKEEVKVVETVLKNESVMPINTNDLTDLIQVKNEVVNELKDRIKYLEQQVEKKDQLIENQSQQLNNFQILLKQEQDKTLYLQEAAVTAPKSWWHKWFKK